MSLESIYRVLSHAYKAASEANGGTADEKGVVDVLGGLTALVESRLQLHKRATVPAASGTGAPSTAPPARAPAPATPSATPGAPKRPTPAQADDSYDLK